MKFGDFIYLMFQEFHHRFPKLFHQNLIICLCFSSCMNPIGCRMKYAGTCSVHTWHKQACTCFDCVWNKDCICSVQKSSLKIIKITASPSCNFRKSPVGLFCHRVVILCHCILRHPPVTSPTERHPAISRIINLHQLLIVRRIIGF